MISLVTVHYKDRRSLLLIPGSVSSGSGKNAEGERNRFRRRRVECTNETTFCSPLSTPPPPVPPGGFFIVSVSFSLLRSFGLRSVRKRRVEKRNFPSSTGDGTYTCTVSSLVTDVYRSDISPCAQRGSEEAKNP